MQIIQRKAQKSHPEPLCFIVRLITNSWTKTKYGKHFIIDHAFASKAIHLWAWVAWSSHVPGLRILYILPECDDKFEHCNEDFNFFYNPSTKELEIPPLPNQLLPLIKAFDMKSGQGRGYVSFTIPLKGSEICLVKKEVRKPVAASIYSNLSDDDEVWMLWSLCIFLL